MPAARTDLYLVGYGVADTLQITIESQRVLTRVSTVFAVSMPPNLAKYVRALGAKFVDVGRRFDAFDSFADVYLDIAGMVLRKAEDDPPVALLSPGNPLLSNALARFVLMKARERKLAVQVLPGVSPIDVGICLTGLDVGTFGLQVFDARRVVSRSQQIDPTVPLLLLQLAGLSAATAPGPIRPDPIAYQPLVRHLARFYPPEHPAVLLSDGSAGPTGAVTFPLRQFGEIVSHIDVGSTLFLDLVRKRAGAPSALSR